MSPPPKSRDIALEMIPIKNSIFGNVARYLGLLTSPFEIPHQYSELSLKTIDKAYRTITERALNVRMRH